MIALAVATLAASWLFVAWVSAKEQVDRARFLREEEW